MLAVRSLEFILTNLIIAASKKTTSDDRFAFAAARNECHAAIILSMDRKRTGLPLSTSTMYEKSEHLASWQVALHLRDVVKLIAK